MSGHRRWEGIKPMPDKQALEIQMAYVQGYILAIEDLFKDLAETEFPAPQGAETEHESLRRRFLFRRYRKDIRRKLLESMQSAQRTQKTFTDMYEGRVSEVQADPGPVHQPRRRQPD